ncbi:hypothetical protein BCR39DRAFT_493027 [Naematelia encephala]|uniref:Uncharacterized protein n=1 Tax=Naematelia encephala TaxID=71784 RepID=A0A1Y2BC52_9TREE|nr:hypothetical protein BCR39DRAFT_493027 [Naematelia encephala]
MRPFKIEEIAAVVGQMGEMNGHDIRVPIGHGNGRLLQLGKINLINIKVYIESARYTMIYFGGYSDEEVDVLSEAFLKDVESAELYTRSVRNGSKADEGRYHALSVRRSS